MVWYLKKNTGVFHLALNILNFQSMHPVILFATSLIIHVVSQVFSVWSFLRDDY